MGLTVKQACTKLGIGSGRVLYMLRVTHQIKGKKTKEGDWDIDPKTVANYRQEQIARHKGQAKKAAPKKKTVRKSAAREMLESEDGEE